ncbi:MAG: LuxR C-terminal-related transcriptional regulator [Roseiflexaceae bacterium]
MVALPTGTVTFLFTDIEGSTVRWEQHPQAMPGTLARHDAILRDAIEAQHGVVFRTVGDAFCAAFAHAPAAIAAALTAQRALHAEDWGVGGALRVRMAVHTGAVELHDGDYQGLPLNRIARLLAAGHGGQTLISRAAEELAGDMLPAGVTLRDLGTHRLKDLTRLEQIYMLVAPGLPTDFPPPRTLGAVATNQPPAAPLLATKLYAPAIRPGLVHRPRLTKRLNECLRSKLTLIAAPAGFGKTTLVSEWLASPSSEFSVLSSELAQSPQLKTQNSKLKTSAAWVSLDAGDNDPPRFWTYVIAALDGLRTGIGASALALLQALQPPPIEAVLTPLLNALSALPADAMLVLDDYHVIEAPPIHQALVFLLDHLPPRLHLIITTRTDPPLPLTRLRARSQLTELRAADLRFTPEEAAAFLLDARGIPLAGHQIAALDAHTEGWIAGLQLAALAMRDHSDVDHFITAFTGSNRFVVDYLADEVVDRLPAHLRSFLLQTAILDRMCGPLCDAVLGLTTTDDRPPTTVVDDWSVVGRQSSVVDSYSQLILDELEHANLFLVALDDQRQWYRYHHLFAEVLRHRLSSDASAAAVAALHRRAAEWFEQQGWLAEAIRHAFLAHDLDRAARLIERAGAEMATQGQVHTVLGWLRGLPDPLIRAHPVLCIVHAATLMYTNQIADARARLMDAERWAQADAHVDQARGILGQVATLRGNIARFGGDLAGCVALAQQALDLLPETEVFAHAGPLMRIGRTGALVDASYDFLVSGDASPAAERRITAAITTARAVGNLFAILRSICLLARLQIIQGRLRAATATYGEAAQIAPGPSKLQTLVNSAAYYFGMGELQHEWNDLDSAERYLTQGIELVRGMLIVDAQLVARGYLTMAQLQQVRGDSAGALATLDTFVQLAAQRGFAPDLVARAEALRARLALANSDLPAASQWAETSGLQVDDTPAYPREDEYMTLARVLIAQRRADPGDDRPHAALRLLGRLLAAADAGARVDSAIEIHILRALALHAQGDLDRALRAIERALALAEPEGYIRIFVDEGAPLATLLREAHRRRVAPAYIARLLAAEGKAESEKPKAENAGRTVSAFSFQLSDLPEALTEREREVLGLLAAGASNREIAHKLILSLGTVKKHINNIFGKLDVQSRTQAISRARDLQLL